MCASSCYAREVGICINGSRFYISHKFPKHICDQRHSGRLTPYDYADSNLQLNCSTDSAGHRAAESSVQTEPSASCWLSTTPPTPGAGADKGLHAQMRNWLIARGHLPTPVWRRATHAEKETSMTAVGGMAISRAPGITKLADRQPLQSLYEGILWKIIKPAIISSSLLRKNSIIAFLKRNKNEFFHLLQGQQLSLAAFG